MWTELAQSFFYTSAGLAGALGLWFGLLAVLRKSDDRSTKHAAE